jgi:uncharacterized protein YodC (DUF2158 family)
MSDTYFEIGDVVYLKGFKQQMTITSQRITNYFICSWFHDGSFLRSQEFNVNALTKEKPQ